MNTQMPVIITTSGVTVRCADIVVRCYIRRLSRMLNLFESNNMKKTFLSIQKYNCR